jgi:hypothetical protein
MDADQKTYLAERFEGFLTDIREDYRSDGTLGPKTVQLIACLEPMVAWLRGKAGDPGPDAHAFLEERLEGFEDTVNWEALAYEHDALVAALEACA